MDRPDPQRVVRQLKDSALIASRRSAEAAVGTENFRPLTDDEIRRLEARHNRARDWQAVRVHPDFNPDALDHNRFEGRVFLGVFGEPVDAGRDAPSGVYDSTLRDCTVGSGARVDRCGLIERCFVGEGATLESVGRMTMSGSHSFFGNDLELFHEPMFSRRLRAVAELPFEWAAWATGPEATDERAGDVAAVERACGAYAEAMRSETAYAAPGARIVATPLVENCWIGPHVSIEAAGSLRNAALWGAPDEPTVVRDGAQVRDALVGPGCTIENLSFVARSIFFEHVHAEGQAVIKGSAVGPNCRLGEGEINDSLAGPFVTAVHQSLLIAAWWPEGKGNVAYGANVGSNHTGRAPDQEIWPGEGVFFGLGCNVKFPSNFREAPYTIVATGVDALPQKVLYPFSLIMPPVAAHPDQSPAYNEIRPGWGLLHNAYGIERREQSLRSRNRARRTPIETDVFRRALVGRFAETAALLERDKRQIEPYYTEADIAGLGKNILTETGRRDAIAAYEFGLRFGAARCLLRALERKFDQTEAGEKDSCLSTKLIAWCAKHLEADKPELLLDAALKAEEEWLEKIRDSRSRDLARGRAVIDDYERRHLPVEQDPAALQAGENLNRHRERCEAYLKWL